MASTNKTTNYELSQYIGSDKPTYLGDYNSDMLKIDTGMKANETASSTNAGNITQINNNIGTMSSLETTATNLVGAVNEVKGTADTNTSSITTVDNKIGNLANLETDVKTTIVNAINDVVSDLNFTNIKTYTGSDFTTTNGTINSGTLTVATNSKGSIAKIYGGLTVTCSGVQSPKITFQSDLRPSETMTLANAIIQLNDGTSYVPTVSDIKIYATGIIEFRVWNTKSINNAKYYADLLPCLYFITDFGDIPQE